jgi:hypothetical protein
VGAAALASGPVIERLRRVRIAYVLLAFAALVLIAAGVSRLSSGGGGDGAPAPRLVSPTRVRECVHSAGTALGVRKLVVVRSASVTIPVRAQATRSATAGGVRVPATVAVSSGVVRAATARLRTEVRVRTRASRRACARGPDHDSARASATALARDRATRVARRKLPAAVRRASSREVAAVAPRAEAAAHDRADRAARAAAPAAQRAVERRAAKLAAQRALERARRAAKG